MNLQNLNKMWLVWLIALVGGKIAMHFGIKFPDSYANDVADFILQYVAPLVLAWLNKHKDAVKAIKITGDGPAV